MTASTWTDGILNDLLASVTRQCQALLIPIRDAKERFWRNMKEEYGLDYDNWTYSYDPDAHIAKRNSRVKPTGEEPK